MIEWADPSAVHEFALQILLGLFLAAFLTAVLYMNSWFKFVAEIRDKEPEVWKGMGEPSIQNAFSPMKRKGNRMFWAFLPVLRARLNDPRYRHAGATWALFRLGLALCAVMFGMAGFLAYWMEKHGL